MLTLVPTPIGNLEDISHRAIKVIQNADTLFCEDTRVSKKLISLLKEKFNIEFKEYRFVSLHSHNEFSKVIAYQDILKEQNCVYLSDAGMPGISDPGAILVEFCQKNGIEYDVLPGANAALLSIVMSGFDTKSWCFYGFLPHKTKEREAELRQILQTKQPTVIYEAPTRILKLIKEIATLNKDIEVFVAKELTKLNQKYFKNSAINLIKELENSNLKGEWVVVVQGSKEQNFDSKLSEFIKTLNIPKKEMAKIIAKIENKSIKECYNNLQKSK